MNPRGLFLIVFVVACSPREDERSANQPAEQPALAAVSLDQFRNLEWIAGTWRGSGGAYPAFYEEYRALDDSTIQMRAFPDSTFSTATDSSWIELRNGAVRKRGVERMYNAVALAPDSVRFAEPGVALGGHTFVRKSTDEWIATLHPSRPDGQPTVYVMRRIQRSSR